MSPWASSPPPGAVVIDPDADKPKLIGSRWRRRAPEGDAWDEVDLVGVHDNGPDHGGPELCVRTRAFTGEPVMTADADSFIAAYKRAEADDPAERLDRRLRELEARG